MTVTKEISPMTQLIMACLTISGMGPVTVKKYIDQVDDAKAVLDNFDLLKRTTLTPLKKAINNGTLNPVNWQKKVDDAFNEWDKAKQKNIEIISYKDSRYPKNLLALKKLPPILYAKGNINLLGAEKSIAIIGTREPTEFGQRIGGYVAEKFARDYGYVIISGLAIGCDTIAHKAAMKTTKRTIAILAAGLDQPVYPKQNRALAEQMIENDDGLLVSTYPLGTKLKPQYLVERDTWQSGMSDGVIAIQTGIKGGTTHAMNSSAKQDRPLAVIDYSKFTDKEDNNRTLDTLPQALGNKKYLDENKAMGIYYSEETHDESIDKFEQKVSSVREERLSALDKKLKEKKTPERKQSVEDITLDI